MTTKLNRHHLTLALAAVGVAGLGVLGGALIAAPATSDLYNACVADQVVPRAGVPQGQIAPGPPGAPYSDPRTRWTPPASWAPSHAPQATPAPLGYAHPARRAVAQAQAAVDTAVAKADRIVRSFP